MNDTILMNVYEKNDYIRVAEAVTRAKKEFTEEDVERLLTVYEQKMEDTYGLSDKALVKLFMVLNTADWDGDVKDAPLLNLAGEADQNGLTVLAELCRDRSGNANLAIQAKTAALAGEMDQGLALALARAALDSLAGRRDIKTYREDINALLDFLGGADESKFYQASMFLWGVRAKWMN